MKFILSLFAILIQFVVNLNSTFVDPEYKLVKWDGWGGSLGWDAKILVNFNENVEAEIYDALFSPDRLNLNILRYTIGATHPEDIVYGTSCQHCKLEEFRDSLNKPFVWTRDAATRRFLLAAKNLGVDTFEAVAYSPPYWMTRSNRSDGNPAGDTGVNENFDPIFANAFADYLTEVVKHYHDNFNVSFSSLAPAYRPSSGEFRGSPGQEGCNMEKHTVAQVIKSVHSALKAKNLTFCSISTADESGTNAALATQKSLVEEFGVAKLYSKVNVQGRGMTVEEKQAELTWHAEENGHKVWMSEMYFGNSNLPDVTQAINLAVRIIADIRFFSPSAWVWFHVFEYWSPQTASLLQIPVSSNEIEDIQISSAYYAMMQFSKYILKGSTFVHVSDGRSVAAYDENSKTLVIVSVNPSINATTKDFDLSAFVSVGEITAYRTSATEPHVAIAPPIVMDNHITFNFPGNSVTTLQISNAVAYHRNNLIKNGDFEQGSNSTSPWYLMYGTRPDNGVNERYTFRGNYSGNIDFTDSKLSLMQNVTVGVSRTYHLSARCAAEGNGTGLLGVLIHGMQGPEAVISNTRGYQLYGLAIDAKAGDVLSVYIHSERGNYSMQIDNVVLR